MSQREHPAVAQRHKLSIGLQAFVRIGGPIGKPGPWMYHPQCTCRWRGERYPLTKAGMRDAALEWAQHRLLVAKAKVR
jgi:hypothetical protein